MTELTCKNCGNQWTYNGNQKYYCTCPKCLYKVPLKKLPTNKTTFKISE